MSFIERPVIDKQSLLSSGNTALDEWTRDHLEQTMESLKKRDPKKMVDSFNNLPYSGLPNPSSLSEDDLREIIAHHRVSQLKNEALLYIGERMLQSEGSSIGILTLERLTETRNKVINIQDEELDEVGRIILSQNDYKQKFIKLPDGAKREMIALTLARKEAEEDIIKKTIPRISAEELIEFDQVNNNHQGGEKVGKSNSLTQFNFTGDSLPLNRNDLVAPHEQLFSHTDRVAIDVAYWCSLPIKPLCLPPIDAEIKEARDLAQLLWQGILYSPFFVDRNGREVAMDEATSERYLAQILEFIQKGEPIRASEYTPLIAIPNPLKRRTQTVTLAEIDFFRRLAEVSKAVELYYPPGLVWDVINEVPAFTEAFGILPDYVERFHSDCQEVVYALNGTSGRQVIRLSRMDDFLWGDKSRETAWSDYRTTKEKEMKEIMDDPINPRHQDLMREIKMFIYPMATCISPFNCQAAQSLTIPEIVAVYEVLKSETGSSMRGVGMGDSNKKDGLTREQKDLLQWLREQGEELSFNYRLTMDARDKLPAFTPINKTVKYTMVTKPNKPVLYPNSRRGPSFPAHGESILLLNDKGWSTVTVKPWISVLSGRHVFRTTPCISDATGDVLYYLTNN